jgi:transposase InsO family protein
MELREQHNLGPRRIQTNRGREFFAIDVQEKLMEYSIKFKPNKPGSPHLNGKVKRSQRTDLEEFFEWKNSFSGPKRIKHKNTILGRSYRSI